MPTPIRLYPNRGKWLFMVLGNLVLIAGGIVLIHDGDSVGYFTVALFGLGLVVGLAALRRGSMYLELDTDGFLMRTLFSSARISWSDIESFDARLVGIGIRSRMVTMKFAPHYTAFAKGRAVSQRLAGADGALPDTYGESAEDLARLMNEYLKRRKSQDASPSNINREAADN